MQVQHVCCTEPHNPCYISIRRLTWSFSIIHFSFRSKSTDPKVVLLDQTALNRYSVRPALRWVTLVPTACSSRIVSGRSSSLAKVLMTVEVVTPSPSRKCAMSFKMALFRCWLSPLMEEKSQEQTEIALFWIRTLALLCIWACSNFWVCW